MNKEERYNQIIKETFKKKNFYAYNSINLIPEVPGCYLILARDNKVLYVGSSKNLRKRVAHTKLVGNKQSRNFMNILIIIDYPNLDYGDLEEYLIEKIRPPLNKRSLNGSNERKILKLFGKSNKYMSPTEISAVAKVNYNSASKILNKLANSNKIKVVKFRTVTYYGRRDRDFFANVEESK